MRMPDTGGAGEGEGGGKTGEGGGAVRLLFGRGSRHVLARRLHEWLDGWERTHAPARKKTVSRKCA
ncbi:hypothetical protein T492DRAFT_868785 [Pavlovales sp. CCMP2436]|nr:hypothetical protein T492DRAFT_868785 [Pavlovales sp. CCMP2436]